MSIKKRYTLGIMDETKIDEADAILTKCSENTMKSTSHMYFSKQPLNSNEVIQDVTFFQLKDSDEKSLEKKLKSLIEELNKLNTDFILMDDETGKMLMTIDFAAAIHVKFDKVKFLKPGTYEIMDGIKSMKTDIGYCKGFKSSFRPLPGSSIENMYVDQEIIYLVSNSSENLDKLKNRIYEKILEIDSDFEFEFRLIAPEDF